MTDIFNKSINYIFYDVRNHTHMINALHFNDIYCIGDLLVLSQKELKRLKRVGPKTFTAIMFFLLINNLSLRKE